jgi:AcrR family transcriptional regulator
MAGSARETILKVAAGLFFQHGYRAIGVDTIIAESGVAKATFYRHFPSKDDLIATYLETTNDQFWVWFEEGLNLHPSDPREQLIEVFRRLQKLVTVAGCWGCPFLIAATEFPDREHSGHRIALAHKRALVSRLTDLCQQAGARDPQALAHHLFLLMDGAFMAVRMFGIENPAAHVADHAAQLIACAL